MSPSLGRHSTRRPGGRIRKAGRRQRLTCSRTMRAGGVDPIAEYLRLRKDTSAGSTQQLGSVRIDRLFPPCAEGLPKYRAKCATVHWGSLQPLIARREAHGVIWAYLNGEVQGSPDRRLPWLSLANVTCGLGLPIYAQRAWPLEWFIGRAGAILRSQNLIPSSGGRRWRGQ
jgi:hypothetical protein